MKKFIAVILAIFAVIAALAAWYFTRKIDIAGQAVRAYATEISFAGDEFQDISELSDGLKKLFFLKKVELGSFHIFKDQMDSFAADFPGVEFEYIPYVTVGGKAVPADVSEIELGSIPGYDFNLLKEELGALENLKKVNFGDFALTKNDIAQLENDFSGVEFTAVIIYNVCGKEYREDTTEIDLSGTSPDSTLTEELANFPALKKLNLKGTGLSLERLLEIKKAYPELEILAEATLGGTAFSTDIEYIDLNFTDVGDFDTFFDTVSLFYKLEKAELCDSGFSNEQMEKLQTAYPETKFVWRVYLGQWSLRTDAVAFSVLIRDYSHKRMTSEDIQVLKYCTDLQALDLGHQAITDISVIGEYLTELRILILADNRITDLSPLSNLKHLHYLEFFVNQVTDLSPLAECRELVDLNISYNYGLSDITPLLDLPILERLWLEHVAVSVQDVNLLRETYPDTKIISSGTGSIDQGWRTHERYFAMIDMFYNDYVSESFSKYDGK